MEILSPAASVEVGLYVHVAFCRTKCYYCDFNTYAHLGDLIPSYVEALERETRSLPHRLSPSDPEGLPSFRTGSIFFGGGTPSVLRPEQIAGVLAAARRSPIVADAEVTIEANPDDRDLAYYRAIREAGVNRLSLGVQTFDDATLRRLGRRHDAGDADDAVRLARAAGIDNLSLDLMFALPGQTLKAWRESLEHAIALRPEHLSLYNLTIEPDTPYGTWHAAGKLTVPDDDLAADMYQLAIDSLDAAGYAQYEISNWARRDASRDYRAQHNLRYWRNQPYFGVGAGAHSFFDGVRYANTRAPVRYIQQVRSGESTVDFSERIDRNLAMAETMMLGLRLDEGVPIADFQCRFSCRPQEVYGAILTELTEIGLLVVDDDVIRLTERGRFLGNEVFRRFLETGNSNVHEPA